MGAGGRAGRIMAARTALFIIGSLATMVAGLVLARRLDPASYAAMQSVTKRMIQYVAAVTVAAEIWVIRDTLESPARRLRTVAMLTAVTSTVGAVSGFLLVYGITHLLLPSLLAALAGVLVGVRGIMGLVVEVHRPVRLPLIIAGGRILYASLVVALVQVLRKGLLGGLSSFLARSLLVAAAVAYYFRPFLARRGQGPGGGRRGLLVSRARATLPRVAYMLTPNLDVPLVLALTRSPILIGGFFAARLIPFTLVDVMRNTFRYLQASYRRSGWGDREVISSVRLSIALVTPVLAYAIAYPEHVICVISCRYMWATIMVRLFGIEALLLLAAIALENAYLGRLNRSAGSDREHAARVERFYLALLPGPLAYLALLAAATRASHTGFPEAWALAVMAMSSYQLAVTSISWGARTSVLYAIAPLALYLALATLLALALPLAPPSPSPRFFDELSNILPQAIAFYLATTALYLAMDREARTAVAGAARAAVRRVLRS